MLRRQEQRVWNLFQFSAKLVLAEPSFVVMAIFFLHSFYFGSTIFFYCLSPQKTQGNLFKNVVGNVKKSEYYEENGDKFLSRGHLAPDGDFVFGSWQFATYFYINAAPQWQVVNGKNWLTVEKLVRKLGIKVSDERVSVKLDTKYGNEIFVKSWWVRQQSTTQAVLLI